ncbi:MAG: cysteine synthase A [Proteobacteria bacterium]|nr:cysteine synthase A [Pseudomonadota bacterium]
MSYNDTALSIIGNTPLIRLRGPSEATGCEILGKAEFMNPGGSVKDRAALYIVEDAERNGLLEPGGLVVEGTAGNTGIGLAVVAAAKGYRTLIVVPETQTREKIETLRVMGAEVKLVPAKPYSDPGNFQHVAKRLAEELAASEPHGVIWAQQFDNLANREAHIKGTAQEIWEQTQGKVDAFVSVVGTGGTLAGVGMGLKEKNPDIIIALADVPGANMYNWFKSGELTGEGSSITEGIGQSRVTANLEYAPVDDQFLIPDEESLPITFDLLRHEGLCVGASSGVNVAGAIRLAQKMGPGHTIVTLLCDSGLRYASRLFNPEFLREKGLPVPDWLQG